MLNADRVAGWDDENVLETGNSDGHTALRMRLMPLNCVVKKAIFALYIFYHSFLKTEGKKPTGHGKDL